jgi:hypothetical protein
VFNATLSSGIDAVMKAWSQLQEAVAADLAAGMPSQDTRKHSQSEF